MRFGSVCSGIEAASVAWHPLGWQAAWLAEIEPFPCAVLAHHYPTVPNLGDMTTITRRILTGEVEAPDVFTGGTPCQAFSVAGLRQSLSDARGNLSLTFCEIANAIDHVRAARGAPPCIIVWENVPGVLSTKDNAFGCFLAGLAGEDGALEPPGGRWANAGAVYGPTRAVAWRTLDAQYFGLAQRRKRVFVVASARNGICPASVLFEWDRLRRDTPPSREPRKDTAGSTGDGVARCVTAGEMKRQDWETCNFVAQPVAFDTYNQSVTGEVAQTLCSRGDSPGGNAHLVQAIAFHPTQTPISSTDGTTHAMGCGTKGGTATVAIAFDTTQITSATNRSNPQPGAPCHPLAAGAHAPAVAFAIQAGALRTNPNSGPDGVGVQADHAYTLEARAEVQAVAFSSKDYGADAGELSPTLRAMGHAGSHANGGGQVAVAVTGDVFHALRAEGFDASEDGTGRGAGAVATGMAVRRLTPRECERLQGFPDDYTLVPITKRQPVKGQPAVVKMAADGPRYKALGNSWAVPCARWIGARIKEALS